MITRFPTLILVAVVVAGCSGVEAPTDESGQSAPSTAQADDHESEAPTHAAERVALRFVDSIRSDQYVHDIPAISADAELSPQNRAAAFRMLERFVKSQNWALWFTSIEVFESKVDSVDCYLRGDDGGMLVLLLGYHYDANEWRIGAYEIPNRTFARPEGEPYAEYIARSISESKSGAKLFKEGVDGDGRYFIDYRGGD